MTIHIGKSVRALRQVRGWTQLELGLELDMDRADVGKLERLRADVRFSMIQRLARAFGMTLVEFVWFLENVDKHAEQKNTGRTRRDP